MRLSHLLFVAAVLASLGCTPASATTYNDKEFYSYDQNSWGADPTDGLPASLLAPNFFTIFSSGFELGDPAPGGFVMDFSSADALSTYLPQAGAPGALNASLTDPTSSSSGIFGGEVAALRLNIAFNDAGPFTDPVHGTIVFTHPPGITFGDLILTGYGGSSLAGVDGLTVRQVFDIADVMLGGGAEPYAIGDFNLLTDNLNTAFDLGFASTYADDHLLEPASLGVPEPASWVMLIAGFALSGIGLRRARRQAPRIAASQG
jgi:hypothetical protein